MCEEHKRSALKAISWRIIATSTTMILVYVLTGQLELTATVGFLDVILKILFYFIHERGWNRIEFGRLPRGARKDGSIDRQRQRALLNNTYVSASTHS